MALSSPTVESDEFKCLNLNITVPSEAPSGKRQEERVPLLPVKVWAHGYVMFRTFVGKPQMNSINHTLEPTALLIPSSGQFKNGTNSNLQDQPQVLSRLANPFVIVHIKYALGFFGFLASSDLATKYESTTSKVPVCRAILPTSV